MAANHVLYFVEEAPLFFFIYKMCLWEGEEGRRQCTQPPYPFAEPVHQGGGSEDNKSSNWQGCPLPPFLSPMTWPCPIYLHHTP